MRLVLHPKTERMIEQLATHLPHAVLVAGHQGSGKRALAENLAEQILDAKLRSTPYILTLLPDGQSISIDQVRELQKFMQLKTAGKGAVRRIAMILDADTMTIEAQNALLKILEEPPADTMLILTAANPQQLRPTIHSRVQLMNVIPPQKNAVIDHFINKGFSGSDIERAYMMSGGRMGLLSALLETPDDSQLAADIDTAKKIFSVSAFERLCMVDSLTKNKQALPGLLFACKRICMTALEVAAAKDQQKPMRAWHKRLEHIVEAEKSLQHNPNAKLLLTNLFVQI